MIKVAVVGGTGYTGLLLIHYLLQHPQVQLDLVSARQAAGTKIAEFFPSLHGLTQLCFAKLDMTRLQQCDLIFFATPHGVAMSHAKELLKAGCRIIDLSADFRIKDSKLWAQWYQMPHQAPELLPQAVYGLFEIYRTYIDNTQLLANPGCYRTAVQLPLIPLLKSNLIDLSSIIIDAKSGVSGAGRNAKVNLLATEVLENFHVYGGQGHRHSPEIAQGLNEALLDPQQSISPQQLTFVPHLLPMVRGIEATIYVKTKRPLQQIYDTLLAAYHEEKFVDVLPCHSLPSTKSVSGSNRCQIGITQQAGQDLLIISSVIDNLVKGAAGQAMQNMNIMYGWQESCGLPLHSNVP